MPARLLSTTLEQNILETQKYNSMPENILSTDPTESRVNRNKKQEKHQVESAMEMDNSRMNGKTCDETRQTDKPKKRKMKVEPEAR